jgi:hypothetical protein
MSANGQKQPLLVILIHFETVDSRRPSKSPSLFHPWFELAKNAKGIANGPKRKPTKSQYRRSAFRDLAIQ